MWRKPGDLYGPSTEKGQPNHFDRIEALVFAILEDAVVKEGTETRHPHSSGDRHEELPGAACASFGEEGRGHDGKMGERPCGACRPLECAANSKALAANVPLKS